MFRHSVALLLTISAIFAQQRPQAARRVDPNNTHQRLIGVVGLIGVGTKADPRRPAYIPAPVRGKAPTRNGIIAFAWQLSDDKKFALCEFVAADRAALAPILADKSIPVLFEKNKAKKDDIANALKRYKKDFDIDSFQVSVP